MSAVQLNTKTILIVDPDNENREFLKSELHQRGFLTYEADSPAEAYPILIQDKKVDAVVIDLELCRSERESFIRDLQSDRLGNPAIILLIPSSVMSREDAYDKGVAAAMSKPYDPETLVSRIREALLPPSQRWKKALRAKAKHKLEVAAVTAESLGKGGIAIQLPTLQSSIFEGETIEFDMEVKDIEAWRLKGTGVIRYIKYDTIDHAPKTWGVEFESLDDISLLQVVKKLEGKKTSSYIPRTLH